MSKKLDKKIEEYLYTESVRNLRSIKDVESLFSNPKKLEIIDNFYFGKIDGIDSEGNVHHRIDAAVHYRGAEVTNNIRARTPEDLDKVRRKYQVQFTGLKMLEV